MALIRGFTQVDEDSRIHLPHPVYANLGIAGEEMVQIDVVSTRGGTRRPRLMVHSGGYSPRISPLESLIGSGVAFVDEEEAIIPEEDILTLVGFAPGDHLEMKMQGTANQPCLVIYHRASPVRLSRKGTFRYRGKRVKTMKWKY